MGTALRRGPAGGRRCAAWASLRSVGTPAACGILPKAHRPKGRPRRGAPPYLKAVVAVSLLAGAGATWTVVEVGHSGAKATWDDVGDGDGGEDGAEDGDEGADDEGGDEEGD